MRLRGFLGDAQCTEGCCATTSAQRARHGDFWSAFHLDNVAFKRESRAKRKPFRGCQGACFISSSRKQLCSLRPFTLRVAVRLYSNSSFIYFINPHLRSDQHHVIAIYLPRRSNALTVQLRPILPHCRPLLGLHDALYPQGRYHISNTLEPIDHRP